MSPKQRRYLPFDPDRFPKALETALGFWQQRLHLQDWLIGSPLAKPDMDSCFRVRHTPSYRTIKFHHAPAEDEHWRDVEDRWCAHAICHEMMHLMLAPIGDIAFENLAGTWYKYIEEAEETCCDRLASLIWGLLDESDRQMLTTLFAEAREKPRKKGVA